MLQETQEQEEVTQESQVLVQQPQVRRHFQAQNYAAALLQNLRTGAIHQDRLLLLLQRHQDQRA
jgi:hypothetical protein